MIKKVFSTLLLVGILFENICAWADPKHIEWKPMEDSSILELSVGEPVYIDIDNWKDDIDQVSGLPPGLEFDNSNGCDENGLCLAGIDYLKGTPTKAGRYVVTFSSVKYRNGAVIKTVKRTIIVYGPVPHGIDPSPSDLADSYGPYTPGEKMLETISALVGYTAKGLPSGLKLNKKTGEISGTPKKSTGDAGVTATFTKKGAETLTTKFIVGPIPTINVTMKGDTEKCKVTGANKEYLVGKKVNLQAKAPKGTAFAGWFKDGEPWPSEEEYLSAKIKYTMTTESLNLVACFEKEIIDIDTTELESAALQVGSAMAEGEITIAPVAKSGIKSITASKLPTGLKLKFNKSTGIATITGTPKKAGKYQVTLKVTSKSGAIETLTLVLAVVSETSKYPSWLIGTFDGRSREFGVDGLSFRNPSQSIIKDNWESCGWSLQNLTTITIDEDGKVTLMWAFSDVEESPITFHGKVTAFTDASATLHINGEWCGKKTEWDIDIEYDGDKIVGTQDILIDDDKDPSFLYYEVWKRDQLPEFASSLSRTFTVVDTRLGIDGEITLQFGRNGAAKAKYKNNNSNYTMINVDFDSRVVVMDHTQECDTWKIGVMCCFCNYTSSGDDTQCLDFWLVFDVKDVSSSGVAFSLDNIESVFTHDYYVSMEQ